MRRLPDNSITKRLLAALLCLAITSGCGMTGATDASGADAASSAPAQNAAETDEPELVEPVGSVTRFVPAEYRELSRVTVCQGTVCPDTVEYAYESSRPFGNYGALPGDAVSKGDVLFYGAADAADDEIDAIEEENLNLLEEFTAYSADMSYDINKAKKAEFEAAEAYQEICSNAPDPDSPWYDGWAKGAMPAEKRAKQARIAREKLEQSYREAQEQHDLLYAYNEQRIARLEAEKNAAAVSAPFDGVVVASTYHIPGDSIAEGTHILAVGDTTAKEIQCEYVSKSVVNKAVEIYALIEGKRYEVQYEVMEADEYRRIKARDGDVYTTFHLADPDDQVTLGQYAVIVIVENRRPNVLCVPIGAVSKDDRGSFVFLYENGESVYTPVQTGEYDSAFMEITSGLKEGDPVVYDPPYTVGKNTVKIERGETSSLFSMDGYLYYPSAEWLVNPAKTGTCYLNEVLVNRYQLVEKGDVLAKIEIVSDDIEIARIRRKIDRQNERLADLNKKRAETYNKEELESIDRAIRDRNMAISSLNRQLDKLARYSGIYEIKATESGIITDLTERKSGELIGYRERIVQISRDDSCFILIEDKDAKLSYGDTATVTVRSVNIRTDPIQGTVVTVSPWGLTREMRTGFALVKVAQEDMTAMAETAGSNIDNGYWSRNRFGVEVTSRHMGGVLMVPRKSVYTAKNGGTYVITKKEDGTVKLVKFVSGGTDSNNYWVAYGDLTEGMEVCSE